MDTSENNGTVNIGQVLNQARIRRRLSIDQVSESLHIRRDYILALEQNNWDELPGEVYGQGFLKNYSKLVDLDEDAMVEQRRIQIGQPSEHPVIPPMEPVGRTALYARGPSRMTAQPGISRRKPKAMTERDNPEYSNPKIVLWVIGALVVLFVGGLVFAHMGRPASSPPLAAKRAVTTERVVPKKSGDAPAKKSSQVKSKRVAHHHATPPASPVTVSLQTTSQSGTFYYANYLVSQVPVAASVSFTGDCWATYWINGVVQPGKMYYAGQKLSFSGSQSVEVSLGTHLATVSINGQKVALPSSSRVLNMTFTGQ